MQDFNDPLDELFGGTPAAMTTILKLNAYGGRWHVMIDGRGIVFTGKTRLCCVAYCRRHSLAWGSD